MTFFSSEIKFCIGISEKIKNTQLKLIVQISNHSNHNFMKETRHQKLLNIKEIWV